MTSLISQSVPIVGVGVGADHSAERVACPVVESYADLAVAEAVVGVDQLGDDIWDRHVHRRGMRSRVGIEQVESETYVSYQQADLAARRWLDDHVC